MGGSVPAVCGSVVPTNKVGKDYSISVDAAETCSHKRFLSKVFDPNLDLPPIYAHQGCIVNEFDSLVNRHIVDSLETSAEVLDGCKKALRSLLNNLGHVIKYTNKQLINSRPQRMRRRYKRALQLAFKAVHAVINLFIKFEKAEEIKVPRSIQFRATPYTARLAKYIVPIEKAIQGEWPNFNHGFRFIAKGRNALQRGEDLWKMYNHYDDPTVYLIDHSKFDSRVNKSLLKLEHWFYLQIFPDPWLKRLLKYQVRNKGRSRNGLKYECIARRMSGDANTALGNCLINYALLRHKFGEDAIIYLDGDDSVVFMPRIVDGLDFSDTGMVSKINIVRHFQEIEFCQAQPVHTSKGWLMCREPMRALNRALWKLGAVPKDLKDYLATIGIGEGLCSPEMPIISSLSKVYRSLGGRYKIHHSQYRPETMACVKEFLMPTEKSRVSFANAFGLDPMVQKLIEREILDTVLLLPVNN